jgi:hypothetical protein
MPEAETAAFNETCTECGRSPQVGETWWFVYDDLGEAVTYCLECGEREFGEPPDQPDEGKEFWQTSEQRCALLVRARWQVSGASGHDDAIAEVEFVELEEVPPTSVPRSVQEVPSKPAQTVLALGAGRTRWRRLDNRVGHRAGNDAPMTCQAISGSWSCNSR